MAIFSELSAIIAIFKTADDIAELHFYMVHCEKQTTNVLTI